MATSIMEGSALVPSPPEIDIKGIFLDLFPPNYRTPITDKNRITRSSSEEEEKNDRGAPCKV